jgi:hypothetical protein
LTASFESQGAFTSLEAGRRVLRQCIGDSLKEFFQKSVAPRCARAVTHNPLNAVSALQAGHSENKARRFPDGFCVVDANDRDAIVGGELYLGSYSEAGQLKACNENIGMRYLKAV